MDPHLRCGWKKAFSLSLSQVRKAWAQQLIPVALSRCRVAPVSDKDASGIRTPRRPPVPRVPPHCHPTPGSKACRSRPVQGGSMWSAGASPDLSLASSAALFGQPATLCAIQFPAPSVSHSEAAADMTFGLFQASYLLGSDHQKKLRVEDAVYFVRCGGGVSGGLRRRRGRRRLRIVFCARWLPTS